MDQTDAARAVALLGCSITTLPITYLGLPLNITKPKKQDYMPLIEKVEKRMQGWKGRLISRGGRMQLVNSVLSSIPIYYMQVFVLPKWVIQRLDRIRRQFLWGNEEGQSRGISLLNWDTACIPREFGGMGIRNIGLQNMTLILRWWWVAYTNLNSLWTIIAKRLYWKGRQTGGPNIWKVTGSYFWRQLIGLRPEFNFCAFWKVGDGLTIAFWHDSWRGFPLAKPGETPVLTRISLAEALPIITTLHPQIAPRVNVTLTDSPDAIYWRWSSTGNYSAKSTYKAFMEGSLVSWNFMEVWQCKAPASVHIFTFLML